MGRLALDHLFARAVEIFGLRGKLLLLHDIGLGICIIIFQIEPNLLRFHKSRQIHRTIDWR
jgi:hypothetical protein